MSPEVSERAFEAAIECGLRPDACAGDGTTARELQPAFGAMPHGGYRKRGQLSAQSRTGVPEMEGMETIRTRFAAGPQPSTRPTPRGAAT
jgi:hypothetical protein